MPKTWKELKEEVFTTEQIKELDRRVEQELAKMALQEIRQSLGITQEELAKVLEVSQPELSRVENGKNPLLATLRRYIEALGGELEINAVFGDKRVKVEGM